MAVDLTGATEEVKELVKNQLKHDPRLKTQRIEMSPYAIRCVKHGRIVLDWIEGEVVQNAVEKSKCPICLRECSHDQHWYDSVKALFGM